MGDTISVGRPVHMLTDDVTAMVEARYGKREITDACAVTIASWWQSPGTEGRAFAALASTGTVDYQALADDIRCERRRLSSVTSATMALDMLSTWALSKVRQES